jgi:uncharacterized protein YbaR (Trm112 family)
MIIRTEDDRLPLSDLLRRVLVCPIDHADLRADGATLVCVTCGRVFPVVNGIPDMLVEDE